MLATVSLLAEAAYIEDDFFGCTMYWSIYGLEDYKILFTEMGFNLIDTTIIGHGYRTDQQMPAEHHPVIFAQAV